MRREDLIAKKDARSPFLDRLGSLEGDFLVLREPFWVPFEAPKRPQALLGWPRAPQGALPDATWAPHELSGDSLGLPGTFKNQ